MGRVLLLQSLAHDLHTARLGHDEHRVLLQARHSAHQRDGEVLSVNPPWLRFALPSEDPDTGSSQQSAAASLRYAPPRRSLASASDPCSTLEFAAHAHLQHAAIRIGVAAQQHGLGLGLQALGNLGNQIGEDLVDEQRAEVGHTVQRGVVPLRGGHSAQVAELAALQRLHHGGQTDWNVIKQYSKIPESNSGTNAFRTPSRSPEAEEGL